MMNVCLVDDCDREAIAKGACMKHYQRMRKTGSYELAPRVPYERKPADRKLCSVSPLGDGALPQACGEGPVHAVIHAPPDLGCGEEVCA